MVQTPERHSKLDLKFDGPYQMIQDLGVHKFQIFDTDKNVLTAIHSDRLKKTSAEAPAYASPVDMPTTAPHSSVVSAPAPPTTPNHSYNLQPRL